MEWEPRGTKAERFIRLQRSGCGQDTYQVSGKGLSNEYISLTTSNISSLVIDWLCDEARDRDIIVVGLYCDCSRRCSPRRTCWA